MSKINFFAAFWNILIKMFQNYLKLWLLKLLIYIALSKADAVSFSLLISSELFSWGGQINLASKDKSVNRQVLSSTAIYIFLYYALRHGLRTPNKILFYFQIFWTIGFWGILKYFWYYYRLKFYHCVSLALDSKLQSHFSAKS